LTVACPIAARAASVGLHRFAAQVADAQIEDGPEGTTERLSISPSLASNLLNVALDGSGRFEGWPVAPGVRRSSGVGRLGV
jgi:hypothetical protein